jgi:Xaa-Pro aminopeptidase
MSAAAGFDVRVNGWLDAVRQRYRSGEQPPALYHDLLVLLDEMRMIKDAGERATLRRAGQISAHGHIQAMRATRPGMMEYQVEAEILHTFIRNGARYPPTKASWPAVPMPAPCITQPIMRA